MHDNTALILQIRKHTHNVQSVPSEINSTRMNISLHVCSRFFSFNVHCIKVIHCWSCVIGDKRDDDDDDDDDDGCRLKGIQQGSGLLKTPQLEQ